MFPKLPLALLSLITLLSGCAAVDPYNLIGRQRAAAPVSNVPVPSVDDNWRREALDVVWNTINDRYYDPKLNGVDWKAARTRYEPQLAAAASDDQYWELLDKMAGELKDSHTRVESPKQVAQQKAQESHSLGLSFIESADQLLLTGVHAESDAWWAGVRAGMTIKTIDGKPALAHYRELVAAARESSTPWARTRGALRKIVGGDVGTKSAMTFVRTDGSEINVTMARRKFRAAPDMTHRVLPSGFGYVRFSSFNYSLQSGIIDAIDSLKDTPGLILDLRNNGGGAADMAAKIMERFFADDQKGVKLLTRTGKPVSIFFIDVMKLEPELKGVKEKAYTRPLVILTNNSSASASEVVSGALQDGGRATIIGQRTCGCLLGFLGYADLPGGGQMAYSELGFVTRSGKRIEGEGVIPDMEVKLDVQDYVLNRDRVLEAAEKFLKDKTAAAPADKR
jgi:carboxyl-terminal processing protease